MSLKNYVDELNSKCIDIQAELRTTKEDHEEVTIELDEINGMIRNKTKVKCKALHLSILGLDVYIVEPSQPQVLIACLKLIKWCLMLLPFYISISFLKEMFLYFERCEVSYNFFSFFASFPCCVGKIVWIIPQI